MTSTRRGFLRRALTIVGTTVLQRVVAAVTALSTAASAAAARTPTATQPTITHGPFVGDLTSTSARVWAKGSTPGDYRLTVRVNGKPNELFAVAQATSDTDMCIAWQLTGLEPGKSYDYSIIFGGRQIFSEQSSFFVTPPPQGEPMLTRLAIGSCAREDSGTAAVWRRMAALDPHAVVLLGDTPYIDSTELSVQRTRCSEFVAVPDFSKLIRNRPLYATWDDHDFGANDSNGQLEGKERARRAFMEYHVNPSYGENNEGVYTKFRRGGIEVFLLDTRYFAGTAPSPVDANLSTLLGKRQWQWLRRELRASSAPFKLLASGMIWNGAVRKGKPDHWGSYRHEREALFRFIAEENISGVVLAGGDIHRTRVLQYKTEGYPLTELITSPMHGGVIESANAPHADLIFDAGEPNSFLLLTVDTKLPSPILTARFQNAEGRELYSLTLNSEELRVK